MKDKREPTPEEKLVHDLTAAEDKVHDIFDELELSLSDRISLLELIKFQYLQMACPTVSDDIIHQ